MSGIRFSSVDPFGYLVAFDWSHRTGVFAFFGGAVDDRQSNSEQFRNLTELLDYLNATGLSFTIVGEATFEAFNLERRDQFIQKTGKDGHTLLTVPNRLTGRTRKELGLSKTDLNDAYAIWYQALSGRRKDSRGNWTAGHLKAPQAYPGDDIVRVHRAVALRMVELRRTGREVTGPRGGKKFVSAKDDYAREIAKRLPEYGDLTDVQKKAFRNGNGKEYSMVTVAAVAVAAEFSPSTRDFDRLAGLSAHGYGSQVRADLHHYGWAGGNSRGKLRAVRVKGDGPRKDGLTFSEYRRELRWLYHQVRPLVAHKR